MDENHISTVIVSARTGLNAATGEPDLSQAATLKTLDLASMARRRVLTEHGGASNPSEGAVPRGALQMSTEKGRRSGGGGGVRWRLN